MEKQYTFWQRIINDTPSFFRKAQVFGASLVVLSVSLAEIKFISGNVVAVIASMGAAIAAVSQFAVKQYEPININNTPHEKAK